MKLRYLTPYVTASLIFWFLLTNALAENVDFSSVEPILKDRCVMCHSGPNAPLALQLDTLERMLQGSSNGPIVIAGKPGESELILRLKGIKQPRMPMTGPPYLSEREIALIEQWILDGMPAASKIPASTPTNPNTSEQKTSQNSFDRVHSLLMARCVKCHTEQGLMGPAPEGYLLTSYAAILSRQDRVRVVPGHPEASELVRRIKGTSMPRMPLDGPPFLSTNEIDLIVSWIKDGAVNVDNVPALYPLGARVRLHGHLMVRWQLEEGLALKVTSTTRIDKSPQPGDYVEVRGQVEENGVIQVERLRRR